jgi:hypothetical protein
MGTSGPLRCESVGLFSWCGRQPVKVVGVKVGKVGW